MFVHPRERVGGEAREERRNCVRGGKAEPARKDGHGQRPIFINCLHEEGPMLGERLSKMEKALPASWAFCRPCAFEVSLY